MIVSSPSRVNASFDPSTRLDRDGWMLGGVEDLLEGLGDVRPVGVGERLDATGSFPDFEGIDLNLDAHQGVRWFDGVDRGLTNPACDLDGEIVAGLGA
jgi:hypothetical protein